MLKTNYGNKNPTTSSTQFQSALQKQQKHLAQAGRHTGVMLQGTHFPFRVQMQGTWPWWGLVGQPRNRLFQPSLEEEKKAQVIIPNGFIL